MPLASQHDIGGLEVPMDQFGGVGLFDGIRHLAGDAECRGSPNPTAWMRRGASGRAHTPWRLKGVPASSPTSNTLQMNG
jgi:hypothetical protein